jgi:hypothetical protein
MDINPDSLRELLSGEAEKERRAYKRGTLAIVVLSAVALIWLSISSYHVVRLEQRASTINAQIESSTAELADLRKKITQANMDLAAVLPKALELGEVKENLSQAEAALQTIARGTDNPRQQAETTLGKISDPPKPIERLPVVVPGPATTSFLMAIEDVFSIQGRGTVVTGRVQRGKLKVGDEVEIVGMQPTKKTVVTGVEMFRKLLDEALPGDNVGLLLRGIERKDVERGQVVSTPGSIGAHTKFKAEIEMLATDKGGRSKPFIHRCHRLGHPS